MTPEKQQLLFDTYPDFFSEVFNPNSNVPIRWGVSCDNGWFDLIDTLCFSLRQMIEEANRKRAKENLPALESTIKVVQIKEKFGSLRFYVAGYPANTKPCDINAFSAVVQFAQLMSEKICEKCGKPAQLERENGWYRTQCAECKQTNQKSDQDIFDAL